MVLLAGGLMLLIFRKFLLSGALVVFCAFIISCSVFANNMGLDSVVINLPTSCSIEISGNTHTETLNNNTYDSNIGNGATTITTYCNDENGYIIYAIGASDNTEGNTNLVGIGNSSIIATGTATSGDISNWAMKLNKLDNTLTLNNDFSVDFSNVPNSWAWVAKKESGTVDKSTGSTIGINYAAYINGTQAAGSYIGQVKYVMLHPSTAAHPTDTLESAFALAGKTKLSVVDPITGDAGQFYKMQDMDSNICETTSLTNRNNIIRLVDVRDNKLYWVARLDDGHCWMTQNLDLDLSHDIVLTSNDTDLNDGSLIGAYESNYSFNSSTGVISWNPQTTTKVYGESIGSWSNSDKTAYSLDPGQWYWNGNDDTPECNYLTDTCEDFSHTGFTNVSHGHVGNYYNWSAAIASDDSSSLNTSSYDDILNNPKNSICPKGWRLPTVSDEGDVANSTDEFDRITSLYSVIDKRDNNIIEDPIYYVRSGLVNGGSVLNSGNRGLYWSSTIYSGSSAYALDFRKNDVGSNFYSIRSHGRSVRCVAR